MEKTRSTPVSPWSMDKAAFFRPLKELYRPQTCSARGATNGGDVKICAYPTITMNSHTRLVLRSCRHRPHVKRIATFVVLRQPWNQVVCDLQGIIATLRRGPCMAITKTAAWVHTIRSRQGRLSFSAQSFQWTLLKDETQRPLC